MSTNDDVSNYIQLSSKKILKCAIYKCLYRTKIRIVKTLGRKGNVISDL